MLHTDTMAMVAIKKPRYTRRVYCVQRRLDMCTDAGTLPNARDVALKRLIIVELDELHSCEIAIKSASRYREGQLALMNAVYGHPATEPKERDTPSESDSNSSSCDD